jgi:hypothetical protein
LNTSATSAAGNPSSTADNSLRNLTRMNGIQEVGGSTPPGSTK